MPILATKLFVPPPRLQAVHRPHLIERLDQGLGGRLTLICAPAGFGKTTLVSEWLASGAPPSPGRTHLACAWLALDEGDSDPTRFLMYLVAALQTIAPGLGEESLAALAASQPESQPPLEPVLTVLVNEMTAMAQNFVLVLDDYHTLDAPAVDRAVAFLIEHAPPQMHLVMTTREDPQLPLARLRARGQLTELRATDLRFREAEAAGFLNGVMRLELAPEEIAALEARTEGWIAGLQLAALSLQGRADPAPFVKAFAGDHRYIVDYLVEEVLGRQPPPLRRFLLQTSILDRLCGPLCDAVTGEAESSARLEFLERGNFFVVPLDDKRQWYRYHHLFAGVLAAHLRAEHPDLAPDLHRRASAWCEQNGLAAEAIYHALAAGDFARAAQLIEQEWVALARSRQQATLLAWIAALPADVLAERPVLGVVYAHVLLANGRIEGVAELLEGAERSLLAAGETHGQATAAPSAPQAMPAADGATLRRLPGMIAIARAGLALEGGDVAGCKRHARQALDLAPGDDLLTRGAAAGFLGLALWTGGELEAAHQVYAAGMAHLQRAGNTADVVGGAIVLADIRIVQGRLHDALRTYEGALQLAAAQGPATVRGTADMVVGMSELHLEHNDLLTANRLLQKSKEQGEHTGFPQFPYRWRVALARLKLAEGDPDAALDLLQAAEQHYVSDFHPNVQPIAAWKARVWVRQGRLDEATRWARQQGLGVDDDLTFLREFEHLTLARVLLARTLAGTPDHASEKTVAFLERLRQAAEAGGRTGRVIETLLLEALAWQVQGDIPAALAALERGLVLAEPQGYVRIFVDEGAAMAQLLRSAAARGVGPAPYVGKLLAAAGAAPAPGASLPPLPALSPVVTGLDLARPAPPPLGEPLSQREIQVLRLLKTELSGPEIAQELVVALSTLRSHTKAIYGKLEVNSRQAAVERAAELGLI